MFLPERQELMGRLAKSPFRSRFSLSSKDIYYISERGLETIRGHATEFIENRISSPDSIQDGKQTPFSGHPVFVAQHATATCCRSCLQQWHGIPAGRPLEWCEINYVIELLMWWVEKKFRDSEVKSFESTNSQNKRLAGHARQRFLFE